MEEIFTIFFSGANIIVRAALFEHFCPYRAQGCYLSFPQGVALGYGVLPLRGAMLDSNGKLRLAKFAFCPGL